MDFMDAVPLSGVRITGDGYLVADARIARTGIQIYAGREVGRPDLGRVRVYRPETEVFSGDALASMAHRPVTNDHPTEAVTAKNWRAHSVGMTGGDVARDGDFVRVPMTVMDATAIADVQSGKRELSVGYTCTLDFAAGTTPSGEAYDATQTGIRANHLAVVTAGRAGMSCRIGDHQPTITGDRHVALKTIMVDGFQVETTDAGEAAITKLRSMLGDAMGALEKANADHTKAMAAAMTAHQEALAAKDGELGAKDAALADAATKSVTGPVLDKLVADRAAIVTRAKSLAPTVVTDGLGNAEIRRAVVAARIGADKVKDKADAYVDALFDNLAAPGANDSLRAAIISANPVVTTDARESAHKAYVDGLTNGWKGAA